MKRKTLLSVVGFTVLATLAGCAKVEMGGRPILKKTVAGIEPGKTTKYEIIQWFGTPYSISEPNKSISLSDMGQGQISPLSPYPNLGSTLVSNPFEFFTPKHKITDSYRVFYYYYTHMFASATTPFYASAKRYKDELFILIDESNQLVVDFVFMPDRH